MQHDYITNWYTEDGVTEGPSLTEVGEYLVNAGFDRNTHRIISWCPAVDVVVFSRALFGHSMLFDDTPYDTFRSLKDDDGNECLQPFSLSIIVKDCSNLEHQCCGYIYSSKFPAAVMKMHRPENETLATALVLQGFVAGTKTWV
jgi:hypothetical protein